MNKNPWEEGPLDFIIASGYDAVPVDDKLLPSHKDEKVRREQSFQLDYLTFIQLCVQSFDYSSIFSYDEDKDTTKRFKSVFKFEDLPRTNYEADYYKVINQKVFQIQSLKHFGCFHGFDSSLICVNLPNQCLN